MNSPIGGIEEVALSTLGEHAIVRMKEAPFSTIPSRDHRVLAAPNSQERLAELEEHEAQLGAWKGRFKAAASQQLSDREAQLQEREEALRRQTSALDSRQTALADKEAAAAQQHQKVADNRATTYFLKQQTYARAGFTELWVPIACCPAKANIGMAYCD